MRYENEKVLTARNEETERILKDLRDEVERVEDGPWCKAQLPYRAVVTVLGVVVAEALHSHVGGHLSSVGRRSGITTVGASSAQVPEHGEGRGV